jgi:gentisate 1,2-dioxygenase
MSDRAVSPVTVAEQWKAANLAPLWDSMIAHKDDVALKQATLWPWAQVRPLLEHAMWMTNPDVVERRVLSMRDPSNVSPLDESTVNTLQAAFQVLLPGESARPHRHSMNAIRFVLEGEGAVTVVDGKRCPMQVGDLILTPGWCWHEHEHLGDQPIIWLDVLDVPLHQYFGTVRFQRGPAKALPATLEDEAFGRAHFLPDVEWSSAHSPLFRYSMADAVSALQAIPYQHGIRRVRYVNPLDGRGVMPMLDCYLVELTEGAELRVTRSTSNALCAVVEGTGTSTIGERTIQWRKNDVFTVPQNNWVRHTVASGIARFMMVSDKDMLARLGLLEEETNS